MDIRVTTISIGDVFEKKRAFVGEYPVTRKLRSLVRSDDVHAVRLDTRNLVATRVVRGVHRGALRGCTHAILVVLADEHARKVPEFRLEIILTKVQDYTT